MHEGLITALAVGGTFIILGLTFALNGGLIQEIGAFFSDLGTVSFPWDNTSTISLLAPGHPAQHLNLFNAAMGFLFAVGVLQVVVLAIRLAVRSSTRQIAETVGNLVFWLGAGFAAYTFLLTGTVNGWFQFWSWLIILVGLSLIAQFIIRFGAIRMKNSAVTS